MERQGHRGWVTGGNYAGRSGREELRRRGWKDEDLTGNRKGDKVKMAPAGRFRQEMRMKPEMDRPPPGDGQLDSCFELACRQEKTGEFEK